MRVAQDSFKVESVELPAEEAKMLTRQGAALRKRGGDGGGAKGSPKGSKKTS